MDVRSIRQIAEEQGVSYEAIRKQIARYSDELKDHIVRQNRTQFIDAWGVNFLQEKRKENPIVLLNADQNEEIEALKAQVDLLKSKLLESQERIISLQDEARTALEDRIRCNILLEDNKRQETKLHEADEQIQTLQKQTEADHQIIEDLQKQRDEAEAEARSYTKSIFGFYRKR